MKNSKDTTDSFSVRLYSPHGVDARTALTVDAQTLRLCLQAKARRAKGGGTGLKRRGRPGGTVQDFRSELRPPLSIPQGM